MMCIYMLWCVGDKRKVDLKQLLLKLASAKCQLPSAAVPESPSKAKTICESITSAYKKERSVDLCLCSVLSDCCLYALRLLSLCSQIAASMLSDCCLYALRFYSLCPQILVSMLSDFWSPLCVLTVSIYHVKCSLF